MNADLDRRVSAGLLIVRLALALTFLYHGSALLFGAFGGPGVVGFAKNLHTAPLVAGLAALAQFGGGLAMLTGVLTRLGALGLMAVMAGAIVMVHLPHGFDVTKGGMEYALTEFLLALAILVAGPGRYTLLRAARPATV